MIQAYRQRGLREGIVYKQISFDFPIEDDDQIVKAYEQAITPRTKLIHVTHMINWVGQTMPVAKIADMAHAHGIEVIADGAHSFGLMDFKIPDLKCDYFGTSLHKFLSAPIGTGMMWISRTKSRRSGRSHATTSRTRATFANLKRSAPAAFHWSRALERRSTSMRASEASAKRIASASKGLLGDPGQGKSQSQVAHFAQCQVLVRHLRSKHRWHDTGGVGQRIIQSIQDSHRRHRLGKHQLRPRNASCLHQSR